MTPNESRTRTTRIDLQLEAAGWRLKDRSLLRLEIPVDGYDAEPSNGITDYCLYDPSVRLSDFCRRRQC